MPRRYRIYWSFVAFLVSLVLIGARQIVNANATNDFYFPLCGASALLRGLDPYQSCPIVWDGAVYPQNPLTAVLVALPFAHIGYVAGSLFMWASISALLVYGILTNGHPWQLLIFTSASYWQSWYYRQWSPLMAAIMFLPGLLPLTLAKPQIGIPVALRHLTIRRAVACAVFGAVSLALMPSWPLVWWKQAAATYSGRPLLAHVPLGLLVLLPALRWRSPRARFALMIGILPTRGIYDLTALWTVLTSPREMLALSLCSWFALGISQWAPLLDLTVASLLILFPLALLLVRRER